MADFSKQWCELNDPEMPHDFDLMKEYNKLQPGYSVSMICEGFGILAVAKGHQNEMLIAVGDDYVDDYIHWKDYNEFIENYKIEQGIK